MIQLQKTDAGARKKYSIEYMQAADLSSIPYKVPIK